MMFGGDLRRRIAQNDFEPRTGGLEHTAVNRLKRLWGVEGVLIGREPAPQSAVDLCELTAERPIRR